MRRLFRRFKKAQRLLRKQGLLTPEVSYLLGDQMISEILKESKRKQG